MWPMQTKKGQGPETGHREEEELLCQGLQCMLCTFNPEGTVEMEWSTSLCTVLGRQGGGCGMNVEVWGESFIYLFNLI